MRKGLVGGSSGTADLESSYSALSLIQDPGTHSTSFLLPRTCFSLRPVYSLTFITEEGATLSILNPIVCLIHASLGMLRAPPHRALEKQKLIDVYAECR